MQQLFIGMSLVLLAACSTMHHSKKQILSSDADVRELSNQLEEATAQQVQLLSPGHYQMAVQKLKQALEQASKSKDMQAGNVVAKEGLVHLAKAVEVAKASRETLQEALTKREECQMVHAPQYLPKEFKELDAKLMAAGRLMEENQLEKAREANLSLAQSYSNLEVQALIVGTAEEAEMALKEAYQASAEKLAPKTYSAAKNELKISKKIIEIEKSDMQNAQAHAENAKYLAERAKYIAHMIMMQNKAKMTREEMILWYQDQLANVFEPFHEAPAFDHPNTEVVSGMAKQIQGLFTYINDVEVQNRDYEKKTAALDAKIDSMVNEQEKMQLRAERKKELLASVEHMFDPNEAEVVRKGNDLLIRSYGFSFPSGSAELKASNFTLLHKLVTAILKFPESKIEVLGNTDSTGSNEINLKLSMERAKNIAEFLVKVAGIDQARIKAKGMGDTEPLAPNNTAEGRAKNRRIEIVIKDAMQE